jgi:HEAT repeat protein
MRLIPNKAMVPVLLLSLTACTAPRADTTPDHVAGPVSVLTEARGSEDPLVRANAIEALALAPSAQADAIKFGLVDPNEGVRFVAAISLGDAPACDLIDLVRPLTDDPSRSVQAAALYALARCDQDVELSPLADMVLGRDPTVRANAALVLGKLGNPSAAGLLRASLSRPMSGVDSRRRRLVELTIAEALVVLGHEDHLEEIRAAFFSPAEEGELIAVAVQMAGQLGDTGLGYALEQLAFNTGPRQAGPELRLIALAALGHLTPQAAQPGLAMPLARDPSGQIRAQVAAALREGSDPMQDQVLAELMADPDPRVRVAAARTVLHRRVRAATRVDVPGPGA